jgi:hypothetical protein
MRSITQQQFNDRFTIAPAIGDEPFTETIPLTKVKSGVGWIERRTSIGILRGHLRSGTIHSRSFIYTCDSMSHVKVTYDWPYEPRRRRKELNSVVIIWNGVL